MQTVLDTLTNPVIVNYLVAAFAGAAATFLTAWFTKLSDWITIQSNRFLGHPVTAAIAVIGQKTISQFSDKKITEAEVQETVTVALRKLGLKL